MDNLITQLQSVTGNSTSDIVQPLITWVAIPSAVFLVLFLIIIIVNSVRRWRMEKAIFAMRDMLQELTERDRERTVHATRPSNDTKPPLA